MGMYDEIDVLVPLEGLTKVSIPVGRTYQTKSLENLLEHYQIREDYHLWYQADQFELDPYSKAGSTIFPRYKTVKKEWKFYEFFGMLCFYGYDDGRWLQFSARCTDGIVSDIKCLEDRFDNALAVVRARKASGEFSK